jgi:hypothetical protein
MEVPQLAGARPLGLRACGLPQSRARTRRHLRVTPRPARAARGWRRHANTSEPLRHYLLQARAGCEATEHGFGVAPGMGTEVKVKVLLEPRQTESSTEDRGVPARARPMEVAGAARNRAQAKHRKACSPWVSQLPVTKPDICWSAVCIGDGIRVKFCVPYPGRSAGFRGVTTVVAENERTRR